MAPIRAHRDAIAAPFGGVDGAHQALEEYSGCVSRLAEKFGVETGSIHGVGSVECNLGTVTYTTPALLLQVPDVVRQELLRKIPPVGLVNSAVTVLKLVIHGEPQMNVYFVCIDPANEKSDPTVFVVQSGDPKENPDLDSSALFPPVRIGDGTARAWYVVPASRTSAGPGVRVARFGIGNMSVETAHVGSPWGGSPDSLDLTTLRERLEITNKALHLTERDSTCS